MQNKPKKCKGRLKAKGNGCDLVRLLHPFHKGLCQTCWIKWLLTTESGSDFREKSVITAVKKVKQNNKVEKTEGLRKLMSVDAYRAKVLQPVINEIARLIDNEQPCIATQATTGKMNGGHYKSVGSHRNMSLNLHNIHIQSFTSNHHKSGDEINYRNGLIKIYGIEYLEYIESLIEIPAKFFKHELEEAFVKARLFRKELKYDLLLRSAKDRIQKRNEANEFIGLYKNK
jgi:hypothetical protein